MVWYKPIRQSNAIGNLVLDDVAMLFNGFSCDLDLGTGVDGVWLRSNDGWGRGSSIGHRDDWADFLTSCNGVTCVGEGGDWKTRVYSMNSKTSDCTMNWQTRVCGTKSKSKSKAMTSVCMTITSEW